MKNSNKPLAAIMCGYERGGTTLVSEILRQHPLLDSGFEGGFLLAETPARFLFLQPYCEMIKDWGVTEEDLIYICNAETWIDVYKRLVEKATLVKDKNSWMFDKTPKYMLHLTEVLSKVPTVPCVTLVRDPRAVLWSWAKRSPLPTEDWVQHHLADHCERYLSYAYGWQRAVTNGFSEQILLVKYEELCLNSEVETKRIFDFIGLDFDKSYVSFKESSRYNNVYGAGVSSLYLTEYRDKLSEKACDEILSATQEFNDWVWK